MDAAALTAAIHARQVSCVEVMTAYLDHIERLNPKVNAIVALQDRAGLLAQAREHDAALMRGVPMGPLHGFPHAVKDLQPVKGIRSTWGSPILKDSVPAADSLMVERLRKADAIMIGKRPTRRNSASAAAPLSRWRCACCRLPTARTIAAAEGLPMGIQIVAPVRRELACLQLAYAYEQATHWTSKRLPPLLQPMPA